MIYYIIALLVFPFLNINFFPFILLSIALILEKEKINYYKELPLFIIFPIIPSIITTFESYPLYLSYFTSYILVVKKINSYPLKDKIKLLKRMGSFGNDMVTTLHLMEFLKEDIKNTYIKFRIRGKSDPVLFITNLLILIQKRVKNIAISEAIRKSNY